MIRWRNICDLEKLISNLIIGLYDEYELNDTIDIDIAVDSYGIINFKNEGNNLVVNLKNCIHRNNTNNSNNIIINKSYNIDICCVCYEDCDTTLKCGHQMCDKCIKEWIPRKNSCPMCRSDDNYKRGYKILVPISIIKKSLYNSGWLCFKGGTKRLRPARHLYNVFRWYRTSDPITGIKWKWPK